MIAILTGYEVVSHGSFDMHFSNNQGCWAFFHVPVGHLYICFGEMSVQVFCPFFFFLSFFFFFFVFLPFLGKGSAYARATATRDPSRVCLRQRQILHPLSKATDRTPTSWFLVGFINHWAMTGTPAHFSIGLFAFLLLSWISCIF